MFCVPFSTYEEQSINMHICPERAIEPISHDPAKWDANVFINKTFYCDCFLITRLRLSNAYKNSAETQLSNMYTII